MRLYMSVCVYASLYVCMCPHVHLLSMLVCVCKSRYLDVQISVSSVCLHVSTCPHVHILRILVCVYMCLYGQIPACTDLHVQISYVSSVYTVCICPQVHIVHAAV